MKNYISMKLFLKIGKPGMTAYAIAPATEEGKRPAWASKTERQSQFCLY